MKRIVVDLDETICVSSNGDYENALPVAGIVDKLVEYQNKGFEIVINTSRNVRTYSGNIGKINANTLPAIIEWLQKNHIPYDEIYIGKPWCGTEGFYVDDKAIRPSEFICKDYDEICAILNGQGEK